ncbi:MAG: phosphatidylserine decarboxylase [Ignavibacteriaceae bacterium]
MFTKYGYNTIGVVAILTFLLIVLSFFVNNQIFRIILIALPVAFLALTLNFFRDPDRTPPERDDVVVSPADGTVLLVKEIYDQRYLNSEAKQISVFMSPLNVHVNRIPVSGVVEYLKYVEGKFHTAYSEESENNNERYETGINTGRGKILFTQVAGYVARRIINELKVGDTVRTGDRFGMIKFGSRVDVIVPINWQPKVKKDDKVTAGETILFEIKD